MPVIVFASSKGGAGKTTAAIILACELVRQKIAVSLIDADPNRHLVAWAENLIAEKVGITNSPAGLTVIGTSEDNVLYDIEAARETGAFVIVDLEGRANITMSYAISMADLVIIPCRASDLDGREAIRIAGFIRQQEKILGKTVPMALLRTQVAAAIHTRIERAIMDDFATADCAVFENRLVDRDAYRKMISHNCLLHELEATTRQQCEARDKAVEAAHAYALEVMRRIGMDGTADSRLVQATS